MFDDVHDTAGSLNTNFVPVDTDGGEGRLMYLCPRFIVKTYDGNVVGNSTACLMAGLDGADGCRVIDGHHRCQIRVLLQRREHTLTAGVDDGIGHIHDVRLQPGVVHGTVITSGALPAAEPVHRPGEKHDARVAVFDEVLDSLASAAFVIAQYTVNSSFFEDVIYEDDGQVCVAQLEDKARTAGVTLPNTRLAGSTKPCL